MIPIPEDRITTPQAVVLVTNIILGVAILTLPRTSVEKANTPDVWISVILGGLVAMMAGVIMAKLNQRYPGKTFFQYSREMMGKWMGWLLSLPLLVYFVLLCGFELRALAEVTALFLLEGTPSWAVMISFVWVGVYLILGGINPIARLFEIIFPITVIIFFLTMFLGIPLFEMDNLRPVLGSGIMPVIKGVETTVFAYTGFEVILLISAFMNRPNKAVTAVLIGILIPIIFYTITVVIVVGVFSVDGVITRTLPTFDLVRSFELRGVFTERFESLFLVIWIMQMFATYTICHYGAALGLAQLTGKNIHPFIYGLLPVIYITAMIPKNINELFKLADFIGYIALFLSGLLTLLLILSKIRGKKGEKMPY